MQSLWISRQYYCFTHNGAPNTRVLMNTINDISRHNRLTPLDIFVTVLWNYLIV